MLGSSLVPPPPRGRVFRAARRIRLSDAGVAGRLRLDALARYLQDVATDDVVDAGWGTDDDLWVVRRTVVETLAPFAGDETVELATWCSGVSGVAAARRTSVAGSSGGRAETETIWIHLDRSSRPVRLDRDFLGVYGEACGGRRASSRLSLPDPPGKGPRRPWPPRASDIDVMGHVNNAVYWAAIEEVFAGELDGRRFIATLEYRAAVDPGEQVELVRDAHRAWLVVGESVRAAAEVGLSE